MPKKIVAYPPDFFRYFELAGNEFQTIHLDLKEIKDAQYTMLRLGGFRRALSASTHPLAGIADKVALSRKGLRVTICHVMNSDFSKMLEGATETIEAT